MKLLNKKILGQDPIELLLILGMIYLFFNRNSEFWSQEINLKEHFDNR
jgi:hypothetical protein